MLKTGSTTADNYRLRSHTCQNILTQIEKRPGHSRQLWHPGYSRYHDSSSQDGELLQDPGSKNYINISQDFFMGAK